MVVVVVVVVGTMVMVEGNVNCSSNGGGIVNSNDSISDEMSNIVRCGVGGGGGYIAGSRNSYYADL